MQFDNFPENVKKLLVQLKPERRERLVSVLDHRQPDITVVLENVRDPHNISAVLRSADSIGVMDLHLIDFSDEDEITLKRTSSSGSNKWVFVHQHKNTKKCLTELKRQGFKIYTTHLSDEISSKTLHEVSFTEKIAIVFGNEKYGLSKEALEMSDVNFVIPQQGMAQSLNISVACAVTLYEAMRQRQTNGDYDFPKISQKKRIEIIEIWAKKALSKRKTKIIYDF